jgi:hypothetical protein
MDRKQELIRELEKIDDLDTMNKCSDIILSRERDRIERIVEPLKKWKGRSKKEPFDICLDIDRAIKIADEILKGKV